MNLENILSGWNGCVCSGGGGDGLTTASVTFIVEEDASGTFNAPFIYIDTYDGVRYIDNFAPLDAITDGTYEVILVDGTYAFNVNEGVDTGFSTTGSAEHDAGEIIVTGDCTVSLVVQK